MLRKDFILCKTRSLLNEFISPIITDANKPRQKFLRQSVAAILLSGSLVVTEFARCIHDDCTDIFHRLKRLLNHLVSPCANFTVILDTYRHMVSKYIQPDTPIIIDLTDIAKPRAKKMKYLALVRDASEKKLVPGYWCVEVYAYLKKKRILPLSLDTFSIEDPAVGSQNLQIHRTVESVNKVLKGRGIWIADRGFDSLNCYETWFSEKCHFMVRQRGDRYVELQNGVKIIQTNLVEYLRQKQIEAGLSTEIVFGKVRLCDNSKQLYLVASWLAGYEEPLILLTTLVVENIEQAKQIVWYYKKRWACEEASQFLKSRIGFEQFRIRRYEAIQRLVILAMFAMGFLSWIFLRSKRLVRGLFGFTSRFRKQSKFAYYRLLDGLQSFVRLKHLYIVGTQLKPLKNG